MLVKLMKTKFDYLEEALIFNPFLRCRLQSIKTVYGYVSRKNSVIHCQQIYIEFFFCQVYL